MIQEASATTEKLAEAESFVDAIAVADLPQDSQKTVFVGVTRVLLCNTAAGIFALEDRCPHAFQPLFGGAIVGGAITCPKHGACFSLLSGKPLNDVTQRPLKMFGVRVRGERIEIANPLGSQISL